jgi:hypothetical protein
MLRRWLCIRNPVEKVQTVLEKIHAAESVFRIHPNPDTAQQIEKQRVGAARRAEPKKRPLHYGNPAKYVNVWD